MSVIIFLIVLGVLIFVHELGHFLVAKKSGIRVDEFAVGFPPQIFSFTKAVQNTH
jgi:regulator of sigma E protease